MPYRAYGVTVPNMKTTLVLDDVLVERVRKLAKERGTSMSSVVEEAIFRMLHERAPDRPVRARLPVFHGGRRLIDIDNREAMLDALDDL